MRRAIILVGGGILGRWAREQQEGFTEVLRAKVAEASTRQRRRARAKAEGRGLAQPGDRATRAQARRLRSLGWKKSLKWIMEHYSRALAGFLIRTEEGRAPRESVEIVVPARPFLGTDAKDRAQLGRIVLAELHRLR